MSQSRQKNQQAGFTLVELSVVLIVIGLLVVSVLKGATMVHDARVRKTAQMVEDIRTASNLFYREQGRLAGDGLPSVTTLDGLIKISGVGASEPDYFRKELIDNRYLNGKSTATGADKWKNALGGEIWVEYREYSYGKLNYIVVTGLATDEDRRFVDMQFDDGDPSTGNVRYDPPAMLIPL